MIVAEKEVERPVIHGRSRLGYDLDAAPARPGVFGGIRVLVELHLLYRGCGNSGPRRLHSIHHQRATVGSNGTRIEKARHRTDEVLIENWKIVRGESLQVKV